MLRVAAILLCLTSLFFQSGWFVDRYIAPKWYASICCIVITGAMYCAYSLFKSKKRKTSKDYILPVFKIIVLFCTMQAVYGLIQYVGLLSSSNTHFRLTGSFDNPAGFAASMISSFPLFLFLHQEESGWEKYTVLICGSIVFITVCLSGSRAGIIAISLPFTLFIYKKVKLSFKAKVAAILFLFFTLFGLYLIKKDSAIGRILIWECAWNMFLNKPVLGYGYGGFEAHYMDYQALYFKDYPNSRYVLLADTVQQPFNEFVQLAVNYGITGIFFFFVCCGFVGYCLRRYENKYSEVAFWCLLSIASFSLFSYPLLYPFVWLMIIFSVFLIVKDALSPYKPSNLIEKSVWTIFFALFSCSCLMLSKRIYSEIKWKYASSLSFYSSEKEILSIYERLYRELKNDRYFLYNFSVKLYEMRKNDESLMVANECRKLWADYDLEMLIGHIYMEEKNYLEARKYYQHASFMCPNRFMPLYQQVLLLEKMGRKEEAKHTAMMIVNKPVKIQSYTIQKIKDEMKKYE